MKISRLLQLSLSVLAVFIVACDPKPVVVEAKEIYVKADTGLDSNAGTLDKPLKTIKKALEVWKAGKELVLLPGIYNEVSGETWKYDAPAGLIIKSTASGVILERNSSEQFIALNVSTVQIENVTFKNFNPALVQSSGKQTLKGVAFENGVATRITKSAEADWSNISFKKSSVTLLDASLMNLKGAVFGTKFAEFTGISVEGSAQLNLENASTPDGPGDGQMVALKEGAKASVKNSSLGSTGVVLYGGGSTKLEVVDTNLYSTFDAGIAGGGTISVKGGSISAPNFNGITGFQGANITVDRTRIEASGGIGFVDGSLQVSNVQIIAKRTHAIQQIAAGFFSLRNSTLEVVADYPVIAFGNNTATSSIGNNIDLGTAASPGGNIFKASASNNFPLVYIFTGTGITSSVTASGNTWIPNVQGADAQGKYAAGDVVGPKSDKNFYLTTGVTLKF